jgi:hypothetical protein
MVTIVLLAYFLTLLVNYQAQPSEIFNLKFRVVEVRKNYLIIQHG